MRRNRDKKSGFVLTSVLCLVLVCSLIAGSMAFASLQTRTQARKWQAFDETLLAAQVAAEKIKSNIYEGFRDSYEVLYDWDSIYWIEDNAASEAQNGTLQSITGTGDCPYSTAQISSVVTTSGVVSSSEGNEIYVHTTVEAKWKGVTRKIRETVRYHISKAWVFDHAYFVNNFGWFSGVDMVINGDVRSNYDIEFNASSLVINGNSYAAGENLVKRTPGSWSWNSYKSSSVNSSFRPAANVDMNADNDDSFWEYGYDANNITRSDNVSQLDMPYVGNLGDYEHYAQQAGGTISQSGAVRVDAVYSGEGPSGVTNAPDQGCVCLVGTYENPIVIDGPVVVEGDLIIGGYFTGKGTIFAGRNVHIINDVIAKDPADWTHPDSLDNFEDVTLPVNLTKDFLGLSAKGSIIIGDYQQFDSWLDDYLKPPFTAEYEVHASDADIGYVSEVRDGVSWFDGDYTGVSGEKCSNADPSVGEDRMFYESSLSDDYFESLNPSTRVQYVDAMIYNNHLTTGYFANNAEVNGGFICRDEALIPSGRMYLNWDPRVALGADFRHHLPMELKPAKTIVWTEMTP